MPITKPWRGMAAAVETTRHLIFWHHQVMVTSSSISRPAFDILAPSRSNGDILQHIRAHVSTSNAVRGEDNGGRTGKRGREEI
jgi:hypothetical protein